MNETALIGFAGLGLMGSPMALNLARFGADLIVWNRTRAKCEPLRLAGAAVAMDEDDLFTRSDVVILMLENETAMDAVLGRGTAAFPQRVVGRTIVHMGTTAPAWSAELGADIAAGGGRYVEAPVSGSRVPAEQGALVAMLAGEHDAVAAVEPLLAPMCSRIFRCGAVPSALTMKLAVNLFLITMVTGLAETINFARRQELDLERFLQVLNATPMASTVSRVKAEKLVHEDYGAQASIHDVLKNAQLVFDAAQECGAGSPLLDRCLGLYQKAADLGRGQEDMVAVVKAIEPG